MGKKKLVTGSIVGLLSSMLALLGMISTCGFPIIAALLAFFGIGASQLSFLSEYQTLFTILAIIALLYGFYTIYFKKIEGINSGNCNKIESQRTGTSCESNFKSKWLAKTMLWLAAFAVVVTFFINKEKKNREINHGCNPCYSTSSPNELHMKNFPCLNDTIINKPETDALCNPKK